MLYCKFFDGTYVDWPISTVNIRLDWLMGQTIDASNLKKSKTNMKAAGHMSSCFWSVHISRQILFWRLNTFKKLPKTKAYRLISRSMQFSGDLRSDDPSESLVTALVNDGGQRLRRVVRFWLNHTHSQETSKQSWHSKTNRKKFHTTKIDRTNSPLPLRKRLNKRW